MADQYQSRVKKVKVSFPEHENIDMNVGRKSFDVKDNVLLSMRHQNFGVT